MEQYEMIGKIGEGTFGEVFKARHRLSGRVVALKKIRIRKLDEGIPKSLLREVQSLEKLQHAHVIELYEYFPHGSSIVIAFEYMISDLHQVMRCLSAEGRPVAEPVVKSIMTMLLKGVAGVHASNLIHRDLKPANLLFSPTGILKLGDFGLARVHDEEQKAKYPMSHEVATRWYRAPELLFGGRHYGNAVDLWAVGCIFAELLNHSPLFPGENDIDQLYRVLHCLGTPDPKQWPELKDLPDYRKITFPHMDAIPFEHLLADASPEAISLLKKFLVYSPSQRISARDALLDPYFFTDPLPLHPSKLLGIVTLPLRRRRRKKRPVVVPAAAGAAAPALAAAAASTPLPSSDSKRANNNNDNIPSDSTSPPSLSSIDNGMSASAMLSTHGLIVFDTAPFWPAPVPSAAAAPLVGPHGHHHTHGHRAAAGGDLPAAYASLSVAIGGGASAALMPAPQSTKRKPADSFDFNAPLDL